ncbi:DUF4345 domain-containing protein [Sphingorhabdus sp. EL138]|jgi:hypothetical protein|uniref:DUF4345 domain-containing protein n=1 Tax=Sphingorhabdus sp. EL138 TaxID=2073156 RepID=UPI0013A59C06|nr:DUF4345 domain-containing protein [Sphingorhabdus sp. EL138]
MTAFRIVVMIFACIPLLFGVVGIFAGAAGAVPEPELYELPEITALDNQFRYLSGVYIGIALMLFYSAGDVVGRALVFRMAILAVFIGGLGRVVSYLMVGEPPVQMVAGMVLELIAPVAILWQRKVIKDA